MHFLSIDWLSAMALTVGCYWLLPLRWRFRFLSAVTLLLLAMYDAESAACLCLLTTWTYLFARRTELSGSACTIAAVGVVTVLAFYKVRAVHDFGQATALDIAIPLGLSYYSFRLLHVLLERYKNTVPPPRLEDFLSYLLFLPTLVVGPIHRYPQFIKDRYRAHWSADDFSAGVERIVFGYFKLAVLGNYLINARFGEFIDARYGGELQLVLYLEMVRNGLSLYIQFSGFSDIAIGFSRLLGFRVMENFNWPYLQPNISRYWRCWHISLTSWCREYIYATVVSLTRNPALAALATLLIIGLWHEASLRFVVWGCYHGAGIIVWQQWQGVKGFITQHFSNNLTVGLNRVLYVLSVLLTVHFVWFGLVIVTQPDFTSVIRVWKTILFG